MKLIIKFPTRSRPEKFKQTFNRYQQFLSHLHEVEFLVSMDTDDSTMNNDETKAFLDKYSNTKYYYGNSKTKIEAVNADLDKLPEQWDILLLASDDMIPIRPGYDDQIIKDMTLCFADTDGVLHYNDGLVGERLNTLCIIGRKYFDRFGYIYHPDYTSVYADNEFTDISRMLHKVVYQDFTIIQHYWKGYVGNDPLMVRNEDPALYEKDKQVYDARRAINFGI